MIFKNCFQKIFLKIIFENNYQIGLKFSLFMKYGFKYANTPFWNETWADKFCWFKFIAYGRESKILDGIYVLLGYWKYVG